jgi:hypothetical protein
MPSVDVLLPTCNRLTSLILTLAGIAGQSHADLHVIIADHSHEPPRRAYRLTFPEAEISLMGLP